KLWNASRYVLMNVEDQDCGLDNREVTLTDADSWIISRLQQVEAEIDTAMNEYRFDLMANTIYAFVWDEYCSWYLELAKVTLTNPTSPQSLQRGTRRTLVRVLEAILRLLHPTMPFITEEIWQIVAPLAAKKGDTIMLQPYPQAQPEKIDQAALEEMRWVMAVISGVRNIRGEMDIPPSKPLPVLLQNGNDSDRERLQRNKHYLIALANMSSIVWLDDREDAPESATSLVGRMRVLVPRGSIIDKEAELRRRRRERAKVEENLNRACAKLDNPSFLEHAPEQIVAQERRRVIEFEAALKDIDEQLARLLGD
ncbi:MAG: class I tRNA ligase family protein, partial [Acidiferrobacterales bacterium]